MVVKSLPVAALACWLTLSQILLAQFPQFLPPPPPPTVVTPDNPSHRYLPPPVGRATLSEKVRALEQLSQSQSNGSGVDVPPLGLSPAQLQQLDSILDSFRDEKGQLNLPSPDSVPKEWIDSILTDPKQRQQAKEMLEQYSRSRNIPLQQDAPSALPPIDSIPANADKNRPLNQEASSQSRSSNQATANQPGRGQAAGNGQSPGNNQSPGNRQSSNNNQTPSDNQTPSNSLPSDSAELPKDVPPQLRQLYETLKQFQRQQQQQQQTAQQADNNADGSRAGAPSNRNGATSRSDQRNNRPSPATRPPANGPRGSAGPKPNTTAPRSPAPRNPAQNASRGQPMDRQAQPPTLTEPGTQLGEETNAAANGATDDDQAGKNASNKNSTNDRSRGLPADPLRSDDSSGGEKAGSKGNSSDTNSPALTPFDEGFDFSKDKQVPINPFLEPDEAGSGPGRRNGEPSKAAGSNRKPAEPFNVTRMAQDPRLDSRSSPGTNSQGFAGQGSGGNQSAGSQGPGKPGFDLRRSVNELGLGPALKRMIEKTLEKQGLNSSQAKTDSKATNPDGSLAGSNSSLPGASGGMVPGPQATERLQNWAESVAKSTNSSTNNSSAEANAQWGKWLRDAWQSIADAPTRSQGSSGSSGSSVASNPGASMGSLPEFRWTGSMTAAVIIFAALVGMLLWFSRRAVTEASDTTSAQAEWVRTVMAQGLKTRADVIRAFHHLVKQSRSVSDWWTHRSIVRYFSVQTPQLATAIDELAVVYEQARYYPEDVELSPQQLAHVRSLLESVKIPVSNRDK